MKTVAEPIDHRITRRARARVAGASLLAAALFLAACAGSSPNPGALTAQRVAVIIDSPERTAADRANDVRRKPAELLAFIAPRPGGVALDVAAGGGYTSELLARAIGPGGTVYAQSQPRDASNPPPRPAAAEGASHPPSSTASAAAAAPPASAPVRAAPRTSAMAIAERDEALRSNGVPAARLIAVAQRFDDPVPTAVADGALDLVTLMFNYHDLGFLGVDRDRMNRALFKALKSGGVYVVADHSGRPGTGISESGTLHRIEEAFLRREIESAGFRLLASADFLRNPADLRDRNTPEPAMPKDEFVLKFVKP